MKRMKEGEGIVMTTSNEESNAESGEEESIKK
jgi:hypothetical protein